MTPAGARVRRRRALLATGIAGAAVLLALATWLGVRTVMVKGELQQLMPLASAVKQHVIDGDMDAAEADLQEFSRRADAAAALTDDPVWRFVEVLPWVGDDAAAIRVSAGAAGKVAAEATSLVASAARAQTEDENGGKSWDLSTLKDLADPLRGLNEALSRARTELDAISTDDLISPLRNGVGHLRDELDDLAPQVSSLTQAAEMIPGLLGADGARNILLMEQNPAEVRTGGGLAGSFALLTADQGEVTLAQIVDSSTFSSAAELDTSLPDSTLALYGTTVDDFVQNISMTPDFTVTAQLAIDWWSHVSDVVPDAVVSIDPEVLAAVLTATGPVALADGTPIAADTLTDQLLVEPYLSLDADEQTSLQRAVTEAVFAQLTTAPIDLVTLAGALADPIEEGRISIWSARADEQTVIADTPLAGPLARRVAAGDETYAVYLNDTTMGKMDSYLSTSVSLANDACRADGRAVVSVAVTLASNAPADAATLPPLMIGPTQDDVAAGQIATLVSVAAPTGTELEGVWDGETAVSTRWVTDAGFPTGMAEIVLSPGEERTLVFRFIRPAGAATATPTVLTTPLLREATVSASMVGC
ncbi:MAG: DUF4012 domain-containing protein [Microbacterium sp.]